MHPVLLKAVNEALTDIFRNGRYADKTIERLLKSNPKWGSRDRAFLAETIYDCVRWWRLYDHLAQSVSLSLSEVQGVVGVHLVLKYEQNLPEFPSLNFEKLKVTGKYIIPLMSHMFFKAIK